MSGWGAPHTPNQHYNSALPSTLPCFTFEAAPVHSHLSPLPPPPRSAVASCRMYTELVRRLGGGNTGGGTAANRNRDWRPDTGPMPWLFYGGTDYVDDPNLDLRWGRRGGKHGESRGRGRERR